MDDPDLETEIERDPRDDEFYEIVDGERIGTPPMSAYAVKVGSRLVRKLGAFTDDNELGEVVGEMLFRLPLKEDASRNRRPRLGVCFVRALAGGSSYARPRKCLGRRSRPRRRSNQSYQSRRRDVAESPGVLPGGRPACLARLTPKAQIYVYDSPTQIRVLTMRMMLSTAGQSCRGSNCRSIGCLIRFPTTK